MVRLWKAWRNNMLPSAGGYGEQAARLIEAFELLESIYQRETKKKVKGRG